MDGDLLKFWARNSSDVWKFFGFEKDENDGYKNKKLAICRLCRTSIKYSGNTTNLGGHLNRYHYNERYKSDLSAISMKVGGNASSSQPTIGNVFEKKQSYAIDSPRAVMITHGIVEFITGDLQPLSVVEGSGFKSMMRKVDHRFKVPSRGYIMDNFILPKYEAAKTILKRDDRSSATGVNG